MIMFLDLRSIVRRCEALEGTLKSKSLFILRKKSQEIIFFDFGVDPVHFYWLNQKYQASTVKIAGPPKKLSHLLSLMSHVMRTE